MRSGARDRSPAPAAVGGSGARRPARRWRTAGPLVAAVLSLCLPGPGTAAAQPREHATGERVAAGESARGGGSRLAPLLDGMGEHHHAVTTDEPRAQRYFDQGLVLHYAFNHEEALRSFREAARIDPECAMCHWGEALTLGPNINTAMAPDRVEPAWRALRRAMELADRVTPRELDYIRALAARYDADPDADRARLDAAYDVAMGKLARAYPDDGDALTLWAEAKMATSPWDYWTEEGEPKEGVGDVLGILQRAMEIDPDNPGANHFFIHAVEAVRPELALESARRLEDLVPGAGHLVHMPGHVYLRLGRYHEATLANERAMAADAAYARQARDQGLYPTLYMPHNPHFLVYSASMEGRGDYAVRVAREMAARIQREGRLGDEITTVQHYWVTPWFALARFGRWSEVLGLPEPPQDLLYPRGVWHFVRGLALLRTGAVERAAAELEVLRRLAAAPALASVTVWDLNSARDLLTIAVQVLTGELAAARGDHQAAVEHLLRGVGLEDSLTYDEPPPWYQPVRHALGAVLVEAGRAPEAERVYRADLGRFPENGWSLYGLWESLRMQGRDDEAAAVWDRFERAFARADVQLQASRF